MSVETAALYADKEASLSHLARIVGHGAYFGIAYGCYGVIFDKIA
jgi:hypothetical protein